MREEDIPYVRVSSLLVSASFLASIPFLVWVLPRAGGVALGARLYRRSGGVFDRDGGKVSCTITTTENVGEQALTANRSQTPDKDKSTAPLTTIRSSKNADSCGGPGNSTGLARLQLGSPSGFASISYDAMRRLGLLLVILIGAGALSWLWMAPSLFSALAPVLAKASSFFSAGVEAPSYNTVAVERGDIVETVQAAGTLNALVLVEVGVADLRPDQRPFRRLQFSCHTGSGYRQGGT